MLPAYTITKTSRSEFLFVQEGAAAEVFAPQAYSALKSGFASYWYPQYLVTVVIAVDRDRTGARIGGWRDLPSSGVDVGFISNIKDTSIVNNPLMLAAMSYGLEGDGFSIKKSVELLAVLRSENRLKLEPSYLPDLPATSGASDPPAPSGSSDPPAPSGASDPPAPSGASDPPIIICFDYQAVQLNKGGRNFEIVVPAEGTLSYEKGLLSKYGLAFAPEFAVAGGADSLLIGAGFRLPDGRCDSGLYPSAAAYKNAAILRDYGHLNTVCQDAGKTVRRVLLRSRLYASADAREHYTFTMVYAMFVGVWIVSIMLRATKKAVRHVAVLTGIILLCWIILRYIKWEFAYGQALVRYLWYSLYLFQLALPLLLIWIAWDVDQPEAAAAPPKWFRLIAAAYGLLFALVMTNDLHNLVFRLDLSKPDWDVKYGYGLGFYLVQTACFSPLIAGIAMLVNKGKRGLRKRGLAFLFCLISFLAAYTAGFIARVPIAWESDFSMAIGVFVLLLFEACIRTGLIPVNSKYEALFANSPLRMRITDRAGNTVLAGGGADATIDATIDAAIDATIDADTLIFTSEITGGYAVWQEDISALNRLHDEIKESVLNLEAANAMLAEEVKIKLTAEEENARTHLMEQLDKEISIHAWKLSDMLDQLESAHNNPKAAARVMLLLCYIKRRCNLFFREKEYGRITAYEMSAYLDELAEFAGYSGVKAIVTCEIKEALDARHATLFHDFFYHAAYWATWHKEPLILAHLGIERDSRVVFRLMTSEGAEPFQLEESLGQAIKAAGGIYSVKNLDDAAGLAVSFTANIGGGLDAGGKYSDANMGGGAI